MRSNKRKFGRIVLLDGPGKNWKKSVVRGVDKKGISDEKTKISIFGKEGVDKCERVVEMFVDSVFGERAGLITERWVKYPEDDTKGAFWNTDSLLRNIWLSHVEFRVDGEFVMFFKNSMCTKVRISELNDQETTALGFMVENRGLFFCLSDVSPSGDVTLHGFMYNKTVESRIDRKELLMGVIAKMLYACMDDVFLDIKSIVITSLNSMLYSCVWNNETTSKMPEKIPPKALSLMQVLEYVKMPIHIMLSEYKKNKNSCYDEAWGCDAPASGISGPFLLGGVGREAPPESSLCNSPQISDAPATLSRYESALTASKNQPISTTFSSKIVKDMKSSGEFAMNSPIYDFFM
jgi:hypothetical protein